MGGFRMRISGSRIMRADSSLLSLIGLAVCLLALILGPACGGGEKKKDPVLIAESKRLASQGSYWYERGCYSRAERFFFQAMETARLLDDLRGMLRARNNLGAVALAQGRYDEAGEHLAKALELNDSVKSRAEESLIFGNLAGLAFKAGRFEEAEKMWLKAVAAAELDQNQTGLALHLNNLGMYMRTRDRLDEAEKVLRRAQAAAAQKKQTRTLAATHLQLGLTAQARDDLIQAQNHVSLALALDKEAENPPGIAQDHEKLGLIFQQRKMWAEAARGFDRAIYLYSALADRPGVERVFELLKSNQARSGKPESLAPYQRLLKTAAETNESILCR